jgi:putative FmdB family regulatory protein
MPLFEYKCAECGSVTEFLESSGSKAKHPCSKCGSGDTSKVFSTFAPMVKDRASGGKCDSCPESKCPYSN